MTATYQRELAVAIEAAQAAGKAIRDLYDRSAVATYEKGDGSPVTDADLASDRIIRDALAREFLEDAFLTEEGADDKKRLEASRVWIVDPIDGTQQFIERSGEFDVLIALCVDGSPVVGVMLHPTSGRYLAAVAGTGAWIGDENVREGFEFARHDGAPRLSTSTWLNMPEAQAGLSKAAGRLSAADPFVSPYGIIVRHFAAVDRMYDVLIGLPTRPGQTMAWEWDFAAADVIVHEAGGSMTDARGNRFRYNKPVPRNEGGVVLSVDPDTHRRVLAAIRPELPER